MPKLYWYVSAVSTVKPEASLTSFVRSLKDAGVDVVEYDEDTRRVYHRFPMSKLPAILGLWERYAAVTSYELKASGKARRLKPSLLRRVFEQADETPAAVLVLSSCPEGYAVFAELRSQRVTMKLCRREALEAIVTSLPPSLCEWFYPGSEPLRLVPRAQRCITSFYERLLELHAGGESA